MLMQIELTRQEFVLYSALAGAGLGVVFGLVVLILGIRKGKAKLGIIGLIASTLVGGVVSGLLALIVAGIFLFLILKKDTEKDKPVDVRVVNENPIDVKIDDSENR